MPSITCTRARRAHGELAGLGALFATHLRGDGALFAHLAACLARHGLPRTPQDVGLTRDAVRRRGAPRAGHPTGSLHDPRAP